MTRPLPQPTRPRWQPLRAGLVDLFYYDSEEFWFRDGRLLLRGNNGTGKSKVLALTLPFLLDGELSPHRVEPDGDSKKRMEWNLLLGGAHPHPERLGYTWLEFGRCREDGGCEYRTLGCGLKAVAGRGIARHWYFLTSRRVGDGLALVDATGTALTRERLAEALGDHGDVHDRARDYRRCVDEALFGFGTQRYGALVDLLVQLRQPQLSKRPSETALSNALTEALPPLDQAVVSDVAEAFRSLEEDRDALATMVEAHEATRSFLGHYRRYARIASRRRADGPRRAQSSYEQINRELGEAEAGYAAAQRDFDAADAAIEEAERTRVRLRARDDGLRASDEMKSAEKLDRAAEDAYRLQHEATRRAEERDAAAGTLETRERRHAEAQRRAGNAATALDGIRQACTNAAQAARIATEHAARIDAALDTDEPPRRSATELADRQQRATDHVGRLVDSAEQARRELATARQRVEEFAAEAEQLAQLRTQAEQAVTGGGAELVAAVRGYLDSTTELGVDDPAAVLAALELWVETLDGPNPARVAVDAAGHAVSGALARVEADLDARQAAARQCEAELTEAIA
ncbi:MAG: TIGR02680 family protein, partial [Pseudonocardiaceae bacterium]